jgi:tRNA/tmRNA/rRNA uracil-C5-methylase (TrmA/RlmC/RlmD family)
MTAMIKNNVYTLAVEDLTHDGAGVAKVGGIPIFIPGALVGESVRCRVIRVKSRYAIGKLEAVVTASPDRVAPLCPVYGKCGGCQLQHLDYDAQLVWKQSLVQRHMTHIAKSEIDVYPPMGALSPLPLSQRERGDQSSAADLDLSRAAGANGIQRAKPFEKHTPLAATPREGIWRYRHKAILPFGESATGEPILGFYAPHSHRVIPISDCLIQAGPFAQIVAATLAFVRDSGLRIYDEEKHKGMVRALILRRSSTTGKVVVGLSLNAKNGTALSEWARYLQDIPEVQGAFFCRNLEANNVPLSGEIVPLWGDLVLAETLGGVSFLLDPMSFFQVNPFQAARIVAYLKSLHRRDPKVALRETSGTALREPQGPESGRRRKWDPKGEAFGIVSACSQSLSSTQPGWTGEPSSILSRRRKWDPKGEALCNDSFFLGNAEKKMGPIIWDLYAGVGTMGLVFAREAAHILCVEIVPEAAEMCRQNAERNGFDNISVIAGSLEDCLDQLEDMPLPDMVILDPPRQGCHEAVLGFLRQKKVPFIVYVSCDPATFARDVQRLSGAYTCTDVQPIDMFPMTRHVEVVGVFARRG